jgi:large repetitive protein
MRQLRRCSRFQPRGFTPVLVASVSALAFLVPATLGSTDSAAASPSAGYTASLIPTGEEGTWAAVDSDTNTAYISDAAADELSVVNGSTNTVTDTIALTANPRGIAVDPVTDTVYVAVAASTTSAAALEVIDGATDAVTDTVALATGSDPLGVAVDSVTDLVYVAEYDASAVAVIDGSSDTETATVSTGSGTEPFDVAADPASGVVWVADWSGNVFGISEASETITQTVSFSGANVAGVDVDPGTDTVYAAIENTPAVAVIDGSTGEITTTISVTEPFDSVAVDPGSGTVFASSYEGSSGTGTTWVIDESSDTIVDTLQRGGTEIAVNTATGSAYVADPDPKAAWVLAPSAANAMSPFIQSAAAATFTAGSAGSFTVSASALPTATLTESGALPAGVTFNSSGTLSGTAAAGTGGVYPITITASNGIAPDYSQAFTLTVDAAPTLTLPAAVTLQVGVPASIPFQVTGYPAPTLYVDSAPPSWLVLSQLSSGSWELSGTPPAGSGGEYEVTLEPLNAFGSASATMIITVQEAPSFTSPATATFESDTVNTYTVPGGCVPACTYSGTGLPSGLTLDSSGEMTGDPAAGTYNFTITASNSLGTATLDFTLTVQQSVALGVETDNFQLYVQTPVPPYGWADPGGVITAAPAVAAVPTPGGTTPVAPLFFAPGSNQELWMYSVTAGWAPVGPSVAFCLGSPAAVVTGSTLTVACEGLNRQLYYNTATLPSSGLPSFTGPWVSLGGILSAGPAVAPIGGVLTFFAEGTNGQVFTNTGSGYTPTNWICISTLAAATDSSTGITTFGCQGGDHTLWTATNPGTGWSAAHSLGGQLMDGPGIATGGGVTEYFVEGLNGIIWEWTAASGWTSLDVPSYFGVGAVALN